MQASTYTSSSSSAVNSLSSSSQGPHPGDRFIPNRATMNMEVGHYSLLHKSQGRGGDTLTSTSTSASSPSSPSSAPYKATLSSSLFGEPDLDNYKILSLLPKPSRPLPTVLSPAVPVLSSQSLRRLPTSPDRILDAPGLIDDYYINILDWSSNLLGIALGNSVYLWNSTTTTSVTQLNPTTIPTLVTSLTFSPSAQYLALGKSNNLTEIFDLPTQTKVRTLSSHSGRVVSLSWAGPILSSGSFDTTITSHDIRLSRSCISTLTHHNGEVCGLKWNKEGTQLASGGNDNLLNIWDGRLGSTETPIFTLEDHKAAVKALAWCPFQSNLLCSGGGTSDRTIKFWNTQTGHCIHSTDTASQVCALLWSTTSKEIISAHGYSDNHLCLWKYPTGSKLGELKGHTQRVMHLALSPDGTTVASASPDETLRLWRVFEGKDKSDKRTSVDAAQSRYTLGNNIR